MELHYKSQDMGANEANQVINVASALEFSSAQRSALSSRLSEYFLYSTAVSAA